MKSVPGKPAQFWLIDDSVEQLKLITKIAQQVFDPKGVELVCQSQASSVLTHLEDCLQMARDLPYLILLDLYLPTREAGWQLLEQIRQLPAPARHLPILVLSASREQHDIEQSYDRGATTYFFKPESVSDWFTLLAEIQDYWLNLVVLPSRRLV